MSGELLLKIWPKNERRCNIGECPAFHLTGQDWENIIEGSKIVRERGMEEAVRQTGVPVGTCLVNNAEVVVNSRCSVSNNSFVGYFRSLSGSR